MHLSNLGLSNGAIWGFLTPSFKVESSGGRSMSLQEFQQPPCIQQPSSPPGFDMETSRP